MAPCKQMNSKSVRQQLLRGRTAGRTAGRARAVAAQASVEPASEQAPPSVALAAKVGLDARSGVFGFTPFAERWTGRLAMAGIVTGFSEEMLTGHPILEQIGFTTPDNTAFLALMGLISVGVAAGTASALFRANTGDMSAGEVRGFARFLGVDDASESAVEAAASQRKTDGDFTGQDDLPMASATARSGEAPADALLLGSEAGDLSAASAASSAAKASDQTPAEQAVQGEQAAGELKGVEQAVWGDKQAAYGSVLLPEYDEAAYMSAYQREVELKNGRAAMLGFAAAVTIEAATGYGILPQLIVYGKMLGILGADSGF